MSERMKDLASRALENLPAYLRRYAPEMVDELRRVDPEFERAHDSVARDRRNDPVLIAADKLEALLEDPDA